MAINKGNIETYLEWRGDLPFTRDSLNDVDNLVFSWIIFAADSSHFKNYMTISQYIDSLKDSIDMSKASKGLFIGNSPYSFSQKVASTNRFKDVVLYNYVNDVVEDKDEQFSALTFIVNEKLVYVGFEGTDDSFAGWLENLKMINHFPVKAQLKAKEYLENVMNEYPDHTFIVGGHSKGGNLAVYAATYCDDELKKRIVRVYSNDGPGFTEEFDYERYKLIDEKTIQILPKDSLVGNLFNNPITNRLIVNSTYKNVLEHDPISWVVKGKEFEDAKELSKRSMDLKKEIQDLLDGLTEKDKVSLIESVEEFMDSVGARYLIDLKDHKLELLNAASKFKKKMIVSKFIVILVKYKML